jgi:hypothetical protein
LASSMDGRLRPVRVGPFPGDQVAVVFGPPKTSSSYAWIALSDRVVAALTRQRERQRVQRLTSTPGYEDQDLVFARRDGRPLRPEYVLRHFRALTGAAGLPRIRQGPGIVA